MKTKITKSIHKKLIPVNREIKCVMKNCNYVVRLENLADKQLNWLSRESQKTD